MYAEGRTVCVKIELRVATSTMRDVSEPRIVGHWCRKSFGWRHNFSETWIVENLSENRLAFFEEIMYVRVSKESVEEKIGHCAFYRDSAVKMRKAYRVTNMARSCAPEDRDV